MAELKAKHCTSSHISASINYALCFWIADVKTNNSILLGEICMKKEIKCILPFLWPCRVKEFKIKTICKNRNFLLELALNKVVCLVINVYIYMSDPVGKTDCFDLLENGSSCSANFSCV